MPPDGNFEDYVVLTQDTLAHRGAEVKVGGATATTVHIALSNSAGQLDLQAVPTGNGTVVFPTSGGTLLTNINVSGGTTSSNISAVTFSNAHNVSFGFDGSNVTATATVASTQASINISAGTTSNLASAFTFSNSNGVSFGLNASTITASIATSLTNINVSAGTTSNNLSAVVFSNSNSVSFGLNGSTVTASVPYGLTGLSTFGGDQIPRAGNMVNTSVLSLQPFALPYNLTVTQFLFMQSASVSTTALSQTYSVAIYTIKTTTGGVSNWTLSLASSVSTTFGAASAASNTGVGYTAVPATSWGLTPGNYVIGLYESHVAGQGVSILGQSIPNTLPSAPNAIVQSLIASGVVSTTNLPSSLAVSDTANYVRTGSIIPYWYQLQGT